MAASITPHVIQSTSSFPFPPPTGISRSFWLISRTILFGRTLKSSDARSQGSSRAISGSSGSSPRAAPPVGAPLRSARSRRRRPMRSEHYRWGSETAFLRYILDTAAGGFLPTPRSTAAQTRTRGRTRPSHRASCDAPRAASQRPCPSGARELLSQQLLHRLQHSGVAAQVEGERASVPVPVRRRHVPVWTTEDGGTFAPVLVHNLDRLSAADDEQLVDRREADELPQNHLAGRVLEAL